MNAQMLLACGMVAISPLTRADLASVAKPYTKTSADGKYLWVMLPEPGSGPEYQQLRAKYPKSGLYLNNGSTNALWTVDWLAEADAVAISSDGLHLARQGPPPPWNDKGQTLAVAFYREGRELKSYRVAELVSKPELLPRAGSHYLWCKSWSFNSADNLLRLETLGGSRTNRAGPGGGVLRGGPGVTNVVERLAEATYLYDLATGVAPVKTPDAKGLVLGLHLQGVLGEQTAIINDRDFVVGEERKLPDKSGKNVCRVRCEAVEKKTVKVIVIFPSNARVEKVLQMNEPVEVEAPRQ